MIEWILSKLFKRKYFTNIENTEGEDFSVVCHGYVDRNNIVHVLKCNVLEFK